MSQHQRQKTRKRIGRKLEVQLRLTQRFLESSFVLTKEIFDEIRKLW